MKYTTNPHNPTVANAAHTNPFVAPTLEIRDTWRLAGNIGRLSLTGEKIFGFVAVTCHSRYKSNAKNNLQQRSNSFRGGLLLTGEKIIGLIANMYHGSYKSNAKTTPRKRAQSQNSETVRGQGPRNAGEGRERARIQRVAEALKGPPQRR